MRTGGNGLTPLAAPGRQATVDRADIDRIVESVVGTLGGDIKVGDLALYSEIEALARVIDNARAEIAALRPDDVRTEHIPAATDEMDAIVVATEHATNAIMAAAEAIEAVVGTLPPEIGAPLSEAVTAIYEACGFQDITGQRISKVVRALKHIEATVARMVDAFGGGVAANGAIAAEPSEADSDRRLLNGPQLPVNASSQDDIDALFASIR